MVNRSYIRKLPVKNYGICDVWVEELANRSRIDWWVKNIQPEISKNRSRPDWDWNWPRQYDHYRRLFQKKRPSFFALCAEGKTETVVLALCYCLAEEQYPLDSNLRSTFGWYLTSAPKHILSQRLEETRMPGLIGRGSLDAILIKSVAQGHKGRVWLHADPEGGEALLSTYSRWGMDQIPENVSVIRFKVEVNDGRYFYYNEISSDKAMMCFDQYRES
jgi:hypothetical protein